MLCDNCKRNEANFHKVTNINGKISEFHLCEECANNKNLTIDNFSNLYNEFKNYEHEFIDDFFNCDLLSENNLHLIKNSNEYFIDEKPNINLNKLLNSNKNNTIENLKKELEQAIREERYEDAREIKNKLEKLKKEGERDVL